MAAARHPWRRGERLSVRGAIWRVVEHTLHADCESLRLRATQRGTSASRTILLPFDRPRLLPDGDAMRVLRPRVWLRRLRAVHGCAAPAGGLDAAARAGISILPYQLEPALLMRRHGTPRVMIADAVGLGKTIQAGLLLAELAAERDEARSLVVVPAGLRDQWSRELATHFAIETIGATTAWLARATADLPHDVNPWSLPGTYVASSDLIKRPEVLRPLEDVTWDAVIVDEAHEASGGTARRAAVHAVACRARRVMLLTATPHAGDDEQFNALCSIGAHGGESPPIVMFARSRTEVAPSFPRRTRLFAIRLSPHERRMHRLLDEYSQQLWHETRRPARLVAIVLRKRALSSAASLAASCLRRLRLLEGDADDLPGTQLMLPLGDEDPLSDAAPDGLLGGQGLADVGRERQLLTDIAAAAARASAAESKMRFLLRLIARVREPAIVFTEYRDTLERLHRQLFPVRPDLQLLHGGMGLRERQVSQDAFNERSSLLLATDAASEGLNLHTRSRLVIHFELPWSPARLEQRTGRVDRLGQRRPVHEVLLVSRDTAERHVLAPLLGRVARSRSSLPHPYARGLMEALTESEVAASVIEGLHAHGHDRRSAAVSCRQPPPMLRQEAVDEAGRLEEVRACQTSSAASDLVLTPRVLVAQIPRAHKVARGVYAFYTIVLETADGRVVHRELTALRSEAAPCTPLRTAADLRAFAARFRDTADSTLRDRLLRHHQHRLEGIASEWRQAAAWLADRDRSILQSLPSAATRLVQAGLFDQRAIRMSALRARASALLTEEIGRRLHDITASSTLHPSAQLCAVLVVTGSLAR